VALNFGVGCSLVTAQEAASDVPAITIRSSTRLVVVDVVVTDKKGQAIPGLKADDFTVEENGKKQKISIFVPPGVSGGLAPTPVPPGVLSNHPEHVRPAGELTVLLLDATNSPFKNQAYARSQMLKYAAEQGQGGRPMAVMALTTHLQVLQQFTSDPQVLAAAIKNYKPQEQILQAAPAAPESHGVATTPIDRGGGSGNATAGLVASAEAAVQRFVDLQVGYDQERRTLITIEAMKSLSRILGGLPGRKNVVWLTASLPFDLIPEDRAVTEAERIDDVPGVQRRSLATLSSGSQAAEQRALHGGEIREAESQLASANIAIYPVDVTGLTSGMEISVISAGSTSRDTALSDQAFSGLESQQVSQGTMEEVAAQTGGKAYKNQNEIKDGITLAVSDEKASYSLGYYPENKKWDGKFRSLKVKLARGDTQIRYRKGFFAIDPGATKNSNFEQEVAAALEVGAPATQVSFMAQAKPTDPGKMRVVFLVDAHTISVEEGSGGKRLNINLYASVYDASGKSMGARSTKVDHAFDAATYQQVLDKGIMVPIDMDMPAGGQQLRLAVLDNKTGFIGTVSGPLGQ
jgi:VWFA-related protein